MAEFKYPVAQPMLRGNELKYIKECIDTNWIAAGGNFVKRFEDGFASYCGTKYGIACSSGTTALHLALMGYGIGNGDEVIVPVFTFAATANAVIHAGAKPVFVDIERDSWTIDPKKLEEKITKRTKAVMPVHIYGHPADMDEINKIANDYNLKVIEDACPSHGSEYNGRRTGSLGDAGCFSFHASKIITTGEGGMITTDDAEFTERAALIRDQGFRKTNYYWHEVIGYNYKLTNVQAAIGVAQLEALDEKIKLKAEQTSYYYSLLRKVPGISLPKDKSNVKRVLPFMVFLLDDGFPLKRSELDAKLKEHGIDRRPLFYPLHHMPPYKGYVSKNEKFPVAEDISYRGLQIPSSLSLTKEDIKSIVGAIAEIAKAKG